MKKVVLIGCGKMGGAVLRGLLISQPQWQYDVVEHHRDHMAAFQSATNVVFHEKLSTVQQNPDVIVLAVKPQNMDEVLAELRTCSFKNPICISLAAGKTLGYFRKDLPEHYQLIRVMPNTPGAIGAGISVATSLYDLSADGTILVEHVLRALGQFVWVAEEQQMDAVTALSGSGPAYLFYLTEILAQVGHELGLPVELAMLLARETMIGSALLMRADSDKDVALLRKEVTSPKGTTEAALNVLTEDEVLYKLFMKALNAAKSRSIELGHG